jgi:hypothetical protein
MEKVGDGESERWRKQKTSVVAEVQALPRLPTERILEKGSSALIAEIESQRAGGLVLEHGKILLVDPLQEFLNVIEMIEVIPLFARIISIKRPEDIDLHHVPSLATGVDRPFAHVA